MRLLGLDDVPRIPASWWEQSDSSWVHFSVEYHSRPSRSSQQQLSDSI